MTRLQWRTIIVVNVVTTVLILSPFLPGPSFLAGFTNIISSAAQLGGVFSLVIIPGGIIDSVRQARRSEKSIVPILAWTLPLVIVVVSLFGSQAARKVSRTIAMARAEKIISAAEKYRQHYHYYPGTLETLVPTYLDKVPQPWVMGISSYDYVNKNDSYDLTFAQNVFIGFNYEVVVYNPLGKHEADGETPTLYDAGRDGWKYYIYD